jgi:hypothetical protein
VGCEPEPAAIPQIPSPETGDEDIVTSLTDQILSEIGAAEGSLDPAPPSELFLPPTLESYLSLNDIPGRRVEVTHPVVDAVCAVAKASYAGEVVQGVVNAVITKLLRRNSIEGISLFVSAIGVGCGALAAPVTFEVERMDPPLPTEPTSSGPYRASLGELVSITAESGDELQRIAVSQIRCSERLASWPAAPGRTYIGVEVAITAVTDGTDFDQGYWTLDVDSAITGQAVLNFEPMWPALSYGQLPAGETVVGWIAFDVPDQSTGFTVTYRGNPYTEAPLFYVPSQPCVPQ